MTMKTRILYSSMAVLMAVALMCGCVKENFESYGPETEVSVYKVTLTAGIGEDADTRLALGEDTGSRTKVLWSADDSFVLTDGQTRYVFTRSDEKGETASAEFTYNGEAGTLPNLSTKGLKFVYPCTAPSDYSRQTGTEEGLSAFMGMEADIQTGTESYEGMKLIFKHTTAVVKMELVNEAFANEDAIIKLYADGLLSNTNIISTGTIKGDSSGKVTAYVAVPITYRQLKGCAVFVKTGTGIYKTSLSDNTFAAGKIYKIRKNEMTDGADEFSCKLPKGSDFNSAVRQLLNSSITSIKFIAGSSITGKQISSSNAYMVINGDCLEIHTQALEFSFNKSCEDMFREFENIERIDFNDCISTINVTNMWSMFYGCSSLIKLDLRNFDTSRVKKMSFMFCQCKSLSEINGISSFNTENVTDMFSMFFGCSSLIKLDLGKFDTSRVKKMSFMFCQCKSLSEIKGISSFNTENVTNMEGMFSSCYKLTILDLKNFNTENVTDMKDMFAGCNNLTELDLKNFNTENVIDMQYMFADCDNLTELDLKNFNTENVTDMHCMFNSCYSLTELDLKNFSTKKVTNMRSMFFGCSSLIKLNIGNFDTGKVTDMFHLFANCSSLTEINGISNFNTENVTDMEGMFANCRKLTGLDLKNFITKNVTNMRNMFSGCNTLTQLDLSSFKFDSVENFYNIFKYLGQNAANKPIDIKVTQAGYDILSTKDTGINSRYAQLVIK